MTDIEEMLIQNFKFEDVTIFDVQPSQGCVRFCVKGRCSELDETLTKDNPTEDFIKELKKNGGKQTMMIFEKAIENYAKARKEYHEAELKKEIASYNMRVEKMTATGECELVHCSLCPLWILPDNREHGCCRKLTKQQIRELLAMEIKE